MYRYWTLADKPVPPWPQPDTFEVREAELPKRCAHKFTQSFELHRVAAHAEQFLIKIDVVSVGTLRDRVTVLHQNGRRILFRMPGAETGGEFIIKVRGKVDPLVTRCFEIGDVCGQRLMTQDGCVHQPFLGDVIGVGKQRLNHDAGTLSNGYATNGAVGARNWSRSRVRDILPNEKRRVRLQMEPLFRERPSSSYADRRPAYGFARSERGAGCSRLAT